MRMNKIKKAMGLGQIFGIIVVAIVAAFIINRIRTSMSTATNAHKRAEDEFGKALGEIDSNKGPKTETSNKEATEQETK